MIGEAKSRGRRLDNGEWAYGYYVFDAAQNIHVICANHKGSCNASYDYLHEVYLVDPATVGQFTGLKDKNGKEIYRGHILKYTRIIYTDCSQTEIEEIAEPGLIELIQYHPMASIIKPLTDNVKAFGWDQETGEALVVNLTSEEVEIVGNICENSELLESLKGGDNP